MEIRTAVIEDLQQLKAMYLEIVENMNSSNINIWDEVYPSEFLMNDIVNNQLYVLIDDDEIVSAFALCQSNDGADSVTWKDNQAAALYIDRLGVNVNHSRKGIGSISLIKAIEMSREKGAEYLRLFVIVQNYPAIKLYKKIGFQKANGIYNEVIDDGLVFHEYGFEISTSVQQ